MVAKAVPPEITMPVTKLLPLLEILELFTFTVLRLVIVWPLIKPLMLNEIGVMLFVPLARPITEIPSMAGVILAVMPAG